MVKLYKNKKKPTTKGIGKSTCSIKIQICLWSKFPWSKFHREGRRVGFQTLLWAWKSLILLIDVLRKLYHLSRFATVIYKEL